MNCVLLFDFPNQDCGGFIHLKENDPSLERDSDVTVISPNYPGPVGQDKICRWAITVINLVFNPLHLNQFKAPADACSWRRFCRLPPPPSNIRNIMLMSKIYSFKKIYKY